MWVRVVVIDGVSDIEAKTTATMSRRSRELAIVSVHYPQATGVMYRCALAQENRRVVLPYLDIGLSIRAW